MEGGNLGKHLVDKPKILVKDKLLKGRNDYTLY